MLSLFLAHPVYSSVACLVTGVEGGSSGRYGRAYYAVEIEHGRCGLDNYVLRDGIPIVAHDSLSVETSSTVAPEFIVDGVRHAASLTNVIDIPPSDTPPSSPMSQEDSPADIDPQTDDTASDPTGTERSGLRSGLPHHCRWEVSLNPSWLCSLFVAQLNHGS